VHIETVIVARQVDHAAGVLRIRLRCDWNRLILHRAASARIDHHLQAVLVVDRVLPGQALLCLIDRLARVELDR
jgi:hypothetical protein